MAEKTVGVRELRLRLSEHLRRVKAGQTIVITEHGRTVGRIVPVGQPLDERLQAMVDAGLAEWDGKPLRTVKAPARVKAGHSVADLVVEDRI